LVAYNEDGTLDYLGRKDTQIKLHGQRIELGDIEHHLQLNLGEASRVAVDLVQLSDSQQSLAAFVSLTGDVIVGGSVDAISISDVHAETRALFAAAASAASKVLPVYMVPSHYIPLQQLPLNTSGKVDRKSLRSLVSCMSSEQLRLFSLETGNEAKRAPATAMEQALQQLWSELLSLPVEDIGTQDRFFHLGGNSVAAMQLVASARQQAIRLTVSDIFHLPQLAHMAEAAQWVDQEDDSSGLAPFELLPEEASALLEEAATHASTSVDQLEDVYPCTPMQEGLMALSEKQSGAYINQNVFTLPQNIDMDRYKASWQSVVNSHPILRTRIVFLPQVGTCQAVLRPAPIDWRTGPSLDQFLVGDKEQETGFGRSLVRFAIVDGHFVWTIHHALYDGWTVALLVGEVENIYRKSTAVRSTPTPYSHFIRYLNNVDIAAEDHYWKTQLAGATVSSFPPPTTSRSIRVQGTSKLRVQIPSTPGFGLTETTLIRAAWAVVSAAYSGAESRAFGVTLSGRNAPVVDIDRMCGPTITTVPLHVRLDRDIPVIEFLQRLQQQAADMIAYEHTGLQRIRQLSAEAQAACDFQDLLVIHAGGEEEIPESTIGLQRKELAGPDQAGDTGFHTYSLVLECVAHRGHVDVTADYDETTLPPAQMIHVLHQFEHVLQQLHNVQQNDTCTLSEISLISTYDLQQIETWNAGSLAPREALVHHLFERQSQASPDAPAICAWDGDCTYAELDALATQLALQLVGKGIGAEAIVPVCFDKSMWAIVGMLAILKAGGACVALDPSHPLSRRETIIHDTGARIVLAGSESIAQEMRPLVEECIVIDREACSKQPSFTGSMLTTLQRMKPASPENAAFLIYTSGSTGTPKGVVLEHSNVASSMAAHGPALGFQPGVRVLQFASYTFDISIQDIFTTLTNGGCVCVVGEDQRFNDLAGAVNQMGVTSACLTPTVAQLLNPRNVPTLKSLTLAGEAVTEKVRRIWSSTEAALDRFSNCYGPAESTIYCSWNGQVDNPERRPSNIGKGLSSRLWIVEPDNVHKLAAVGCVGELVIEGPLLARGYLNDPAKTAERFTLDPDWASSREPGAMARRMYKTGDLVRYNPADGTIDYLGRNDSQVKVNGQRVEMGEIEHHLLSGDEVQDGAVLLPTAGVAKGRLVAIVSLRAATAMADVTDLSLSPMPHSDSRLIQQQLGLVRSTIADALPGYMVPSAWLVVQRLPLNRSGKYDRPRLMQWLAEMEGQTFEAAVSVAEEEIDHVVPRTLVEEQLQTSVSEILNKPTDLIAINKPFVALGGDSITAMQLTAHLRSQGWMVSVKQILQARSMTDLGHSIRPARELSIAHVSQADAINTPFSLSPMQQFYFELSRGQPTHFNQSFLLRLREPLASGHIEDAVRRVVKMHSMLRARFQSATDVVGGWHQLVTAQPHAYTHYRAQTREEMNQIITRTQTSIDIRQGPVFAVNGFEFEGAQVLFMVAHHLVIDLVSWRIILQDLEALLAHREPPSALSPSLSFQPWLRAQEAYARRSLTHPEKVLPRAIAVSDVAFWGLEEGANLHATATHRRFTLNKAASAALLEPAVHRALRTDTSDVLLASLLLSFHKVFGSLREMPAVFSESHGREPWDDSIDLSTTVGWFTTLMPLYVAASEMTSPVDLVRLVKDRRRSTPANGWEYFTARSLTPEGQAAFAGHSQMELLFNFQGQYQQLESAESLLQPEARDGLDIADIGPATPRMAVIEVSSMVVQQLVAFDFTFPANCLHQDTIEQWTAEFARSTQEVSSLLLATLPRPTRSDFPLLPLPYEGLDRLAQQQSLFRQHGDDSVNAIEDIYPCSPVQQGLLLAQRLTPGAYEVRFTFEVAPQISGAPVDVEQLFAAWQHVVDRHAALRTFFIDGVSEGNMFDQVVLRQVQAPTTLLHCVDRPDMLRRLAALPTAAKDPASPAHRLIVFKGMDGEVYCSFEINHALIDAVSMGLILRDVSHAYARQLPRARGPLYSSYIGYLQSAGADTAIEHWTTHLKGIEPCHFPLSHEHSEGRELRRADIQVQVSGSQMQQISQATAVTVASVLKTAWGLVLRAFVRQDDICFGSLASGRDVALQDINETVGPFINMLVARMVVDPAMSIAGLLRQVHADHLRAMEYQHCSLADIQHRLNLGGRALFNTMMSIQRSSAQSVADMALHFEALSSHDPTEVSYSISSCLSFISTLSFILLTLYSTTLHYTVK
jgi:amino acid adenylation domain-containing protein/non-ribosomal peptide synthase protein (TIGR01720 family)